MIRFLSFNDVTLDTSRGRVETGNPGAASASGFSSLAVSTCTWAQAILANHRQRVTIGGAIGEDDSNRFLASSYFDLFQGIETTAARPGANFAGFLPIPLSFQIRIPERPGSTLDRPGLVDGTTSRLGIEQNTVPIGILNQTAIDSDLAHELVLEVLGRDSHQSGHRINFRLIDPDIPRFPATAITALRASKSETFGIPGRIIRVTGFHLWLLLLCLRITTFGSLRFTGLFLVL